MAESLSIALALGNAHAGIADLRAQLFDTSGVAVGGAVSTGFVERGNGNYLWFYNSFPDLFRGGVDFYSNAAPATILAIVAVNPFSAFPAGAIEFTYTVTNSVSGLPIEGVEVWFATDVSGANIVWRGDTDAFGIARDAFGSLPRLDAGTYYVFRQRAGFLFNDPDVEIVS